MYTVIRILAPLAQMEGRDRLIRAVEAINARIAGEQLEQRPREDGYAAGICELPTWHDHESAIRRFIGEHREALALAQSTEARIAFDVAVYPEDAPGAVVTSVGLSVDFLAAITSVPAEFVVSIYRPWEE